MANSSPSNDNYDPDRLTFDREQLRRFYVNHGYADFTRGVARWPN